MKHSAFWDLQSISLGGLGLVPRAGQQLRRVSQHGRATVRGDKQIIKFIFIAMHHGCLSVCFYWRMLRVYGHASAKMFALMVMKTDGCTTMQHIDWPLARCCSLPFRSSKAAAGTWLSHIEKLRLHASGPGTGFVISPAWDYMGQDAFIPW